MKVAIKLILISIIASSTAVLGAWNNAPATKDENYDNSTAKCREFAKKFDNTCDPNRNAPSKVSEVPVSIMMCDKSPNTRKAGESWCAINGTESGGRCRIERRLCITCREDQCQVYIRA